MTCSACKRTSLPHGTVGSKTSGFYRSLIMTRLVYTMNHGNAFTPAIPEHESFPFVCLNFVAR